MVLFRGRQAMADNMIDKRLSDKIPTSSEAFVFPGPRDRVTINGKTGQGKSTFALWLFAMSADFDKKPWVFVDYKREEIIAEIVARGFAKVIRLQDPPPKAPGIYVVFPNPGTREDTDLMIKWLWAVYNKGKIGLFLDEVTMIPEEKGIGNSGGPFKSILSQGRSKQIPCYSLCQRPVDVNRHVYTECEFYSAFKLRSKADFEKILDFLPEDDPVWNPALKLPLHWSRWYDDRRDLSLVLRPSPEAKHVLDILEQRLEDAEKSRTIRGAGVR